LSNLIFDHAFCFCEPSAEREVALSRQAGFTLTAGVKHQGQGTANRCILFPENYFEFIFLIPEDSALNNPLLLDRRANWPKTGASPFGIALRGSLSEYEKAQFWEYHPPYWPNGSIFIHESNETNPELPIIFVVPSAVRPAEKPHADLQLFAHASASKAIRTLDISGPGYTWPNISTAAGIRLRDARAPKMSVRVDGNLATKLALNEILEICGST
jgi:hypothetical protein